MTSAFDGETNAAENMFTSTKDQDQQVAAGRVLDKLRSFSQELDDLERATLAALLAPGIAMAYSSDSDDDVAGDDVAGFGLVEWMPEHLPDALARAVRDRELRDSVDDT